MFFDIWKGVTVHKFKIPVSESKFVGTEPIWVDGYEPEDYNFEYAKALNWYSYVVESKDCRAFLADWFKGDKEKLKTLSSIPDKLIPRTYANTARIAMRGFPINEDHKERIWSRVQEISNARIKLEDDLTEQQVVRSTKKLPVVTNFIVSDVGDEIENLIIGEDVKNIAQILMPYRMADKHYLDCIAKIEPMLAEFAELVEVRRLPKGKLDDNQLQLLENYEHLSGMKIVKEIVKLLESYISDLRKSYVSKQSVKIRKKKPKDKAKLIRNLKYLKEDTDLDLASVDPTTLLNCSEVWVFDTKTRKLTRYFSPVSGAITVKGASLTGYNDSMSSSKLIRKPETQIKEFMNLKKNDLTKWYSAVKSKSGPVRARLTPTTIILKVY